MNIYTVEVSPYPKTYDISCHTKEEAIAIAHEKFNNDMNGASVYSTEVLGFTGLCTK